MKKKIGISTRSIARAPGRREVGRIVPVFKHMGIVEAESDYTFTTHRHTNYEVILVEQGEYDGSLNHKKLMLKSEEALIVKPGDLHEDRCVPPLRYFGLAFYLEVHGFTEKEAPSIFADNVPPSLQVIKTPKKLFGPLVERIVNEYANPDPMSPHIQDAILLEFFWYMIRALPREAISEHFLDLSFEQAFPQQLRRLFHMNVSRSISIAEMASLMGMSESSLAHKCKDMLGTSPARAFMQYKMERAKAILENTSMPVKQVAFQVGFEDPYHFSKSFKKQFGISPSSCR